MRGSLRRTSVRAVVGGLSLFAAAVVWEWSSRQQYFSATVLPPPSAVFDGLIETCRSGTLMSDVAASLNRVIVGYAIGAGLGILTGILYLAPIPRLILSPLIEIVRPVPPLAWIGLALLWFGFGNPPAYFLVALGAFFPMLSATYTGFNSAEASYQRTAKVLGLNQWQTFVHVTLPQAMVSIASGLQTSLGMSWMIVVTAELVGAQSGLGYSIQIYRSQLQTDRVIGVMLVIGLIGATLTAVMTLLMDRLMPWRRLGREIELG